MRSEKLKDILISFLIAVLVWFYAKMSKTYTIVEKVPVMFVNIPKGEALLEKTDSVMLRITGSGFELIKLRSPFLVYDLSKWGERGELEISAAHLRPQAKVSVEPLFTNSVKYVLDKEETRTVAVAPTLKGRPAKGHIIYGWKVESSVRVSGPKSIVRRLDSLPTYPIDLRGRRRDFKTAVKVFTEGLPLSKVEPESVIVHILIDTIIEREVTVVTRDTSLMAILRGPSRVVENVKRLKAYQVGDSLIISKPQGTEVILERNEEGDTLQ